MTSQIVSARWLVTGVSADGQPRVLADAGVLHADGRVLEIADRADLARRHPQVTAVHHARHMLLPGFVNAHHHVGLTPLALGSPDLPLELWFASRLSARDVDPYLDTLYGAFDMIASGITCVQHLYPRFSGGLEQMHAGSRRVLDAYRAVGMRASFAYSLREQNRFVYGDDAAFCASLPADAGTALRRHLARSTTTLAEQLALHGRLMKDTRGQDLLRVQLAPANLHWMSDDGLQAVAERARADGVPMHMHLLETPFQREYARRRTGTGAVAHLERLGLLGPDLTLGHAVWLDDADIDRLAHSGTCVCHNCSSNLRLRSGTAPVQALARAGITLGLGLDEAGINDDRDMLQEMRLALRLHGRPGFDAARAPTVGEVLRMATEGGAATTPFKRQIGRLAPGMFFDAVAIDLQAATRPFQDDAIAPVDALLLRAKKEHVDTVYIGGDPVYAGGRFRHVDRDAVLDELAETLSRPLTPAEAERRWLAAATMPHVRAFYDDYPQPD
ncbi:amidohydrolase family protein [Xylophilus sp. GOD-11R]|uniref:amidohydrolase family protein n=1 Tax=Xylophilus sp. GOD-11R TaxID=3089814 RepID=UPI00298C837F|nr:amidohydrolase family protein [Xylophilus sp. GOD-11R]WPB55307.1 amidohydrolase family protein [Xylophilus sp. GOD-11R]